MSSKSPRYHYHYSNIRLIQHAHILPEPAVNSNCSGEYESYPIKTWWLQHNYGGILHINANEHARLVADIHKPAVSIYSTG
jgi:hypothetical protein